VSSNTITDAVIGIGDVPATFVSTDTFSKIRLGPNETALRACRADSSWITGNSHLSR
jgi:hypothetical protein